jgi:hypothetical protein
MNRLSPRFVPGPGDVICARGKEAKNHEGNKRYKATVHKALKMYEKTSCKYEKTMIVSDIMEAIRRGSPGGGFVKQESGIWYEVGDHLAREKIGQGLRDSLAHMYKSSTKAKRRRRKVVSAGIADNVDSLVQSNKHVSSRIGKLSKDIEQRGEAAPDVFLSFMFTQANSDILEVLKKDRSLVSKFNEAEEQQKGTRPNLISESFHF